MDPQIVDLLKKGIEEAAPKMADVPVKVEKWLRHNFDQWDYDRLGREFAGVAQAVLRQWDSRLDKLFHTIKRDPTQSPTLAEARKRAAATRPPAEDSPGNENVNG